MYFEMARTWVKRCSASVRALGPQVVRGGDAAKAASSRIATAVPHAQRMAGEDRRIRYASVLRRALTARGRPQSRSEISAATLP